MDCAAGIQWFRTAQQDEHALGYLLQWMLVITVPDLAHLAAELEENGSLSAQGRWTCTTTSWAFRQVRLLL